MCATRPRDRRKATDCHTPTWGVGCTIIIEIQASLTRSQTTTCNYLVPIVTRCVLTTDLDGRLELQEDGLLHENVSRLDAKHLYLRL